MKDLKKLVLADAAVLSSAQLKKIKGGSNGCTGVGGSGTGGQNYKCWCHDVGEHNGEWYGCWPSSGAMWDDIYNICGGYDRGTCDRV